ncbi:Estradiol 17-beta-dehydrogenase 2 [Sarcoptes scabiei]|nr:Estradiol 17-beta-dehydrogenase 2 [Sarcoptes scabiei]
MLRILLRNFSLTFLLVYTVWWMLCKQFCLCYILNNIFALPVLMMISWTISYYLFEQLDLENIDVDENKIVLVTGCDTGFGNRLAARLDRLGFTVFAGVLFPDGQGANDLKAKCSDRLKVFHMDVTKQNEIDDVVQQIRQTGKPLWALVNNAGIAYGVPFDWGNDIDVYQKLFDVNVFGVVRCTKSCSDLLRESKGRIVNVASVAGRLAVNFIIHYCMAKNSVRIFSDVIRRELANTGIKRIDKEFMNKHRKRYKNIM